MRRPLSLERVIYRSWLHSCPVESYFISRADGRGHLDVVVVVVVLTLKTVLTSIQYLLFLTLQGKETNFRGHKL